jgi:Uma2 family endonuclease
MTNAARGPARPVLTIAELERLPREDAYRVELVRGRLVRSPRPGALHARLLARLAHHLYAQAEASGAGAVLVDPGVVLARDPDTVRGPDLAFYTNERIPGDAYATTFWGPPDLAVEIRSPSNRAPEIRTKVADYLAAGVRLVWVIDPAAGTVAAHRGAGESTTLAADAMLDGEDVLPGFRLPLGAFFVV